MFGLFFSVTSIAFRWGASSTSKSWGVFAVFVILIAACGIGSFVKVGGWKDTASQIAQIRARSKIGADFYEQWLLPRQGAVGNLAEVKEQKELLQKAVDLKSSGNTAEAITAFLALREKDPKDPRLAHVLGQLYEATDPEKAAQYFTFACDLTDNNDATYLHDAALFFLNQRNAAKATEFYNLANGASNKTPEMQKLLETLEREIMNLSQ